MRKFKLKNMVVSFFTLLIVMLVASCIDKKLTNIDGLINYTDNGSNTGVFSMSGTPDGFVLAIGDGATAINYSLSGSTSGCTFQTILNDGTLQDNAPLNGITHVNTGGNFLNVACDSSDHDINLNIAFKVGSMTYYASSFGSTEITSVTYILPTGATATASQIQSGFNSLATSAKYHVASVVVSGPDMTFTCEPGYHIIQAMVDLAGGGRINRTETPSPQTGSIKYQSGNTEGWSGTFGVAASNNYDFNGTIYQTGVGCLPDA
ncbi:hypothetical protein QIW49_04105 [Francisellaceae bacterium CB300]